MSSSLTFLPFLCRYVAGGVPQSEINDRLEDILQAFACTVLLIVSLINHDDHAMQMNPGLVTAD